MEDNLLNSSKKNDISIGEDGILQRLSTKEEVSRFDQAQYLVENLQVPSGYSSSDPQHFMFSSTFDGTWNDREVMKNPTVPAKLEMLISLENQQNNNFRTLYQDGVGTEGLIDRFLGGASGNGSEARAEAAYDEFISHANTWRMANPDAEISVVILAFSRGAASGRHYANLVEKRGVPDLSSAVITTEYDFDNSEDVTTTTYSQNLIEPG